MRILLLATRDPTGPPSGRKSVLRTMLRTLVALGHEVELVVLARTPPGPVPPGIVGARHGAVRVHHVLPPRTIRVLANVATRATRGRESLNECLYHSGGVARTVVGIARRTHSDVVVADMIRTAELAFATGLPVVLDLDDLLSRRYRHMASGEADLSTLLGYHRDNLPAFVSAVGSRIAARLIGWEAGIIERREIECARRADVVSLVSPIERGEFAVRAGRQVDCLPMAIESPPETAPVLTNPPTLFLTAKLDYGQNLDALRWYRREVVPHLEGTGLRLDVIGACPRAVRDELECGAIRFLGYVDDLWGLLRTGRAFLAPIVGGTGVKTKVLEAMAAGLPVVSTPAGARGIEVRDGKDCLIASTGREFADKIRLVAADAELAAEIGAAGRELVERDYQPRVVQDRWSEILDRLGRQRTATG
jgi:glycosyltransferase involved in cell wall biosynthesis